MSQQKVDIDISKFDLTSDEREKLEEEILEHIRDRTEGGQGVRRRGRGFSLYSFPGYSKAYTKSLDFRIAGKSSGNVDLTLSGDMLAAMDVLSSNKNKIRVGFDAGSEENDRAEGNQLGSYGGRPKARRARRFLGLTKSELEQLVDRVKDGSE